MSTLPIIARDACDALRTLADARHVALRSLRYARPGASALVGDARGAAVNSLLELHAAAALHAHRGHVDLSSAWWPQIGGFRLMPADAAILIRDGATDRAHEEAYALGLSRWAGEVAELLRDAA